ncbi:MAG: PP2C family serine/threonine-protein phosphatase [Actinoplanes sp.]
MSAREDCASCADERAAGAAFCESCGKALASGVPQAVGQDCPACDAAGTVGEDGYCGNCGILAARPRDHVEADAGGIAAAVTDRGKRHHRNEDAMWLATRGADVDVVVCDGVSSSFDPDVASEIAAESAGKALTTAAGELPEAIAAALVLAGAAVAGLAGSGDPRRAASNPACTIVAACVRGTEIGYGWVGDSRAYWIPETGDATQLTEDDSWATHAIALGAEPQAAWNDPKAHAITAWLGADAGPIKPRGGAFFAETPGHLVLCSDGLWNYLTEPAAFAETVRAAVRDTNDLLEAARTLVGFANDAGGSDNITVALIPLNTTAA